MAVKQAVINGHTLFKFPSASKPRFLQLETYFQLKTLLPFCRLVLTHHGLGDANFSRAEWITLVMTSPHIYLAHLLYEALDLKTQAEFLNNWKPPTRPKMAVG